MIILIVSIVIGCIVGLIFKEETKILSPFGDLFLNMLLIVIVPLIFLTITKSIYKMKKPKRIGKIIGCTFLIFILTSIIASIIGIVSTYSFKLISPKDSEKVLNELTLEENEIAEKLLLIQIQQFLK